MEIAIDIEVEQHIDAPPSLLYGLVADLSRMGEWSPENTRGQWLDSGPGQIGARFVGHNLIGSTAPSSGCSCSPPSSTTAPTPHWRCFSG